jgi:hypothetical protein
MTVSILAASLTDYLLLSHAGDTRERVIVSTMLASADTLEQCLEDLRGGIAALQRQEPDYRAPYGWPTEEQIAAARTKLALGTYPLIERGERASQSVESRNSPLGGMQLTTCLPCQPVLHDSKASFNCLTQGGWVPCNHGWYYICFCQEYSMCAREYRVVL